MRKTKIICTIGPTTCSYEKLERLYAAGMNVVRRNMSHGDHDWHARVIVATHLLESMIHNPVPTRAEVTDVANADYEEADAVMLSGETTIGRYPLKCVEYLDRICRAAEPQRGLRFTEALVLGEQKQSLAASAAHLAELVRARGIVVITRRGRMANHVTNCHPVTPMIYAFSNDSRTRRQLALNRGVCAHRSNFSTDPEKTLANAFAILLEREGFSPGDRVVVISDILEGAGVEAIHVREIPALVQVGRQSDTMSG